jgi:hypothetical protein
MARVTIGLAGTAGNVIYCPLLPNGVHFGCGGRPMGMCVYAGLGTQDKLANLREALAKADCEALILTALDDIACMANPKLPLHGYHVIRYHIKMYQSVTRAKIWEQSRFGFQYKIYQIALPDFFVCGTPNRAITIPGEMILPSCHGAH